MHNRRAHFLIPNSVSQINLFHLVEYIFVFNVGRIPQQLPHRLAVQRQPINSPMYAIDFDILRFEGFRNILRGSMRGSGMTAY